MGAPMLLPMLPWGLAGALIGAGGALASRFNGASFSLPLAEVAGLGDGLDHVRLPVRSRAAAAEVLDANHLVEFLVEHDLDHLGEAGFGQSDTQGTLLVK
jgi:hypothetical protein